MRKRLKINQLIKNKSPASHLQVVGSMNKEVTMSQKDQSILDVIELLRLKYGNSNILIQDYWESDNYAIGICDLTKKYLAYISTHHMKKGRYYVALENPPNNSSLPYSPAGEFDDITLEELFELVYNHLKIQIN